MKIDRLDRLVLTVRDIPATVAFYTRVLGFREITFGIGRKALVIGQQKTSAPLYATCIKFQTPTINLANPTMKGVRRIILLPFSEVN